MSRLASVLTLALALMAGSPLAARIERPKSVVEITLAGGDSPRNVLARLVQAAERAHYEAGSSIEWTDGSFEAVKSVNANLQHRVVIWLEWSLSEPGRVLCVYMLYEMRRKYTGSGWQTVPPADGPPQSEEGTRELRREIRRLAGL